MTKMFTKTKLKHVIFIKNENGKCQKMENLRIGNI